MDELKPCSFCGGKAILVKLSDRIIKIACVNACPIQPQTPLFGVEAQRMMTAAWNRRAKEQG